MNRQTELTPRDAVVFDGATIVTAPGIVMTPRRATEALVHAAVELIGSQSVRVADVGTGTGAVAVAVALRAPRKWAPWRSAPSPSGDDIAEDGVGGYA
jgi:hypothetical protein